MQEVGHRTDGLRDKIAGAVWGHLVGDALGLPYESTPPELVREVRWGDRGIHGQPPGTWSDDGGLTLALLDSLLHGFDVEDQARRALAWLDGPDYKPGPRFDIGVTTRAALERVKVGWPAATAGGTSESDNGNGSLMRIMPVALAGFRKPPGDVATRACLASQVTHGHPRAQTVCAVYCLVLRQLLLGERYRDKALRRSLAEAETCLPPAFRTELRNVLSYSQRAGTGYVVDTFWSGWDAFRAGASYREVVERAILYGGDTDTTAAVAGGLAGIYWGFSEIPQGWLARMRGKEIVEPLIERLTALVGSEEPGQERDASRSSS
jgi:ADP-ribosyl-[dinitrogen reductase] hydrolase